MKKNFKHLIREPLVQKMLFTFLIILATFGIISFWKWPTLPPQLPLYYSLPRGEEQLASPMQFLIIPGLSIFFYGINFLFATSLYETKRLASIVLIIIGTVACILLLITYIRIIFLVS